MNKLTSLLLITTVISVLAFAGAVMAHERHKKPASQTAPNGSQTSQAKPGVPHDDESEEHDLRAEAPRPVPIPFSGSLKNHLHNKIVHFPLALGIAGSLFMFLSLKKPEMITAARVLWFLAAAGALAAYFSGKAQEEEFEVGAMKNILEIHKNLGIFSAITLSVGFLLTLTRRLRGLVAVIALVILVALAVVGYYGGLLAHS